MVDFSRPDSTKINTVDLGIIRWYCVTWSCSYSIITRRVLVIHLCWFKVLDYLNIMVLKVTWSKGGCISCNTGVPRVPRRWVSRKRATSPGCAKTMDCGSSQRTVRNRGGGCVACVGVHLCVARCLLLKPIKQALL